MSLYDELATELRSRGLYVEGLRHGHLVLVFNRDTLRAEHVWHAHRGLVIDGQLIDSDHIDTITRHLAGGTGARPKGSTA